MSLAKTQVATLNEKYQQNIINLMDSGELDEDIGLDHLVTPDGLGGYLNCYGESVTVLDGLVFQDLDYKITNSKLVKTHEVTFSDLIDTVEVLEFNVGFIKEINNATFEKTCFAIKNNPKYNLDAVKSNNGIHNMNFVRLSNKAIVTKELIILPFNFGKYNTKTLNTTKNLIHSILLNCIESDKIDLTNIEEIKNQKGYLMFVENDGWKQQIYRYFIPLHSQLSNVELLQQFAKKLKTLDHTQMGCSAGYELILNKIYKESLIDIHFESNKLDHAFTQQNLEKMLKMSVDELQGLFYKNGIKTISEKLK